MEVNVWPPAGQWKSQQQQKNTLVYGLNVCVTDDGVI